MIRRWRMRDGHRDVRASSQYGEVPPSTISTWTSDGEFMVLSALRRETTTSG
jgi:hypothetical protein